MFLQIVKQFAIFGHVLEAFDASMTVAIQIRVKRTVQLNTKHNNYFLVSRPGGGFLSTLKSGRSYFIVPPS